MLTIFYANEDEKSLNFFSKGVFFSGFIMIADTKPLLTAFRLAGRLLNFGYFGGPTSCFWSDSVEESSQVGNEVGKFPNKRAIWNRSFGVMRRESVGQRNQSGGKMRLSNFQTDENLKQVLISWREAEG